MFAVPSSASETRLGSPASTAGRKKPFPIPATAASSDDHGGRARERQRREHGQAAEVGADHQPLAREPVDERAEQQPDEDRGQDVGDQQLAHPPARVGAVVDVDLERDHRQPVAERPSRRSRRRAAGSACFPAAQYDFGTRAAPRRHPKGRGCGRSTGPHPPGRKQRAMWQSYTPDGRPPDPPPKRRSAGSRAAFRAGASRRAPSRRSGRRSALHSTATAASLEAWIAEHVAALEAADGVSAPARGRFRYRGGDGREGLLRRARR